MAMRLQELHPALVHFPITLLPLAIGSDALGAATGNKTLLTMGRYGMALAAGSAAISAVAGLAAQEAVHAEGEVHDILVTHRNLNLGLVGLTTAMAIRRMRRHRPSLGYLAAGAAGLGVMSYSAYLGGHMVYEHGVGVAAAGGVREDAAPELTPTNAGEAARVAAENVAQGAPHAVEDLTTGEVVPYLTDDSASA